VDEWGLYLQSKTALADQLDLILAGRLDNHSILEDNVYSPRAALVFRPAPDQTLRLSYNQAYSSPSTLNYFLDINNGFAPVVGSLGFGLRAYGTGRDGWSLMDPTSGMPHGFRSPFNPAGANQMLPWGATRTLPPDLGAILPVLAGLSPTPTDLGTMLTSIDGSQVPLAQANLPDVPSIGEGNTETYEIGWTGIINGRVKIAADVYRTTKNNFVSPLLVQTPLVTYNGQDVGAFITVPIVTAITQQLIAQGVDPATAQQQAQQQAATLVPLLAAGIAQVPIGVVSAPFIPGGSDLVVTYRNVGDLTLWGADLALQWFLTDQWTLSGSYSWVKDDTFPIEDGDPISLNAPKHKGSVALAFRDPSSGFTAQTRFRFNNPFPAISAGFEGDVPASKVVDVNLGYKLPNTAAEVQLSVNNVFNSLNESFVGVPSIGRFAMMRVKYDLF
jgi:iron complex outermembrane receptor protein